MKKETIYLDHAATTPLRPEVVDVMTQALNCEWGNPSSLYASGRKARGKIEGARRTFASMFGMDPRGITFTGGASEANNLVLRSNAYRLKARGKHIISTMGEHPSVYEPLKQLEKEGFDVTYLNLNQNGSIDLDSFQKALRQDTILASVMSVNNETGAKMPIKDLADVCLSQGVFLHSDMVQSFGKEEMKLSIPGLCAITVSAHKIGGPKGVGLLAQDPAIKLIPLIRGGSQEQERRAGTENTVGILAFEHAAKMAFDGAQAFGIRMYKLEKKLYDALNLLQVDYCRNGQGVPWIQNICFNGLQSERVLAWLDLEGIEVSAGSACSAGSLKPSRVLMSMYGKDKRLKESLRISFGWQTKETEIDTFVKKIADYIERGR